MYQRNIACQKSQVLFIHIQVLIKLIQKGQLPNVASDFSQNSKLNPGPSVYVILHELSIQVLLATSTQMPSNQRIANLHVIKLKRGI